MQAGPPSLPDPALLAHYAVMAQYGSTMLLVQSFEQALAALVAAIEQGERIGSRASIEGKLRHAEKRIRHLFGVASAKELRNLLQGKVGQDLLEEIGPLIEWRNFLAHSYLVRRLTGQGRPPLDPQASPIEELYELGEAFKAATRRVSEAVNAYVDSLMPVETEATNEEAMVFRDALSAFSRSLAFAQPPLFTRKDKGPETDGSGPMS